MLKEWHKAVLLLGLAGVGAGAWIAIRVGTEIHVANAVVSHTLCVGAFISGVDPKQLYLDANLSERGLAKLESHQRFVIDPARRTVEVTWAGRFRETTVFRNDLGCVVVHDPRLLSPPDTTTEEADAPSASSPKNGIRLAAPTPGIEAALDDAFQEPSEGPFRRTKAVVLLHNGEIVGERYASGYTAGTPIMGYSVSKSVISALIGILVRQGKLTLDGPAPVAEWNSPSDPRRAISVGQLLRMTSGLSIEESDSGLDPVSRMLFLEKDMAGFAERSRLRNKPGSTWEYTSGNTLILSRLLRDAVGGSAEAVQHFAQKRTVRAAGHDERAHRFR